jgi:putative flippase GtrA
MTLAPPADSAVLTSPPARLDAQLAKFAVVGAGSTVVHLGLFAALHQAVGAQPANLTALVLATLGNTAINRRWTFGVTDSARRTRQHVQALLVFALAWALSAFALWVVPHVWPLPSTGLKTLAVAASMALSTLVRFVLMRTWIFRTA